MSWVPGFTAPSPPPHMGWVPKSGWPSKGKNQAKPMKTKQNRLKASTTSTYACIAYA